MSDTYRCAACGGVFEKQRDGWSHEEAVAEAAAKFPGLDIEDETQAAIVCDDCYRAMGLATN